jgi:hypothetical protein
MLERFYVDVIAADRRPAGPVDVRDERFRTIKSCATKPRRSARSRSSRVRNPPTGTPASRNSVTNRRTMVVFPAPGRPSSSSFGARSSIGAACHIQLAGRRPSALLIALPSQHVDGDQIAGVCSAAYSSGDGDD